MSTLHPAPLRALTPILTAHGPLVGPAVAHWLRARLRDAGHEPATPFEVEVDERFWRLRRVTGAAGAMCETRLPVPLGALEVAHALARWAAGEGLSARVQSELRLPVGVVRVVLSQAS